MKFQLPCLSVHQPWVWAMEEDLKNFENRSWMASMRGTLLIHAAKRVAGKARAIREYEQAKAFIEERLPEGRGLSVPLFDDLPRGGIIGARKLLKIHPKRPSASPWHVAGYYGWELGPFVKLPFRAVIGQQRIFHVELVEREVAILKEAGLL